MMKRILINLLKIILVLLTLLFVYRVVGYHINYSTGERYGEITKLSKKGLIFKTWEGELFSQSSKVSASAGNAFGTYIPFSVVSEDVVKQLQDNQGHPVIIVYEEPLAVPMWIGMSSYIVTSVRKAK